MSPGLQPPQDSLYEHRPLQGPRHIRIVDLQPEFFTDQALMCQLREVSIDDPGLNYSCLSYACGNQTDLSPVLVAGEGRKVLMVTQNCAAALRTLRSRRQSMVLWVDSLSISQTSASERSAQVQMMHEIYSKAPQTIVWLGEGNETSDGEAFECLRVLAGLDERGGSNYRDELGRILALLDRSKITFLTIAWGITDVVQVGTSKDLTHFKSWPEVSGFSACGLFRKYACQTARQPYLRAAVVLFIGKIF